MKKFLSVLVAMLLITISVSLVLNASAGSVTILNMQIFGTVTTAYAMGSLAILFVAICWLYISTLSCKNAVIEPTFMHYCIVGLATFQAMLSHVYMIC